MDTASLTASLDDARLRRLIDVGRALVARLDLEGVLQNVLDAARELTGARYAAIGILDEDKHALERFITLGVDPDVHTAIGDLPRGRGVLGELIRHPKPLRLADVGSHPRSYGFPPGHPPMRTFLGVPVVVRGEAWGNLYLTEKAGEEEFTQADEDAVLILADWAAIGIENARLYEGMARQRDQVERQRDRLEQSVRALEAMTDIAHAVGGETQLERVLELIVKRGRALVEARALLIMLAEGDQLVVAATAGQLDTNLGGARIPIDGTLPGQVLRSGRPERLSGTYGLGAELSDLGIGAESALLVPLTFRGSASGLLAALDRSVDGPEFGSEDEQLLRGFAASAATAVATARSVEAERLRYSIEASEQERKRWARELHDETLQALGGLRMLASTALRDGDPKAMRAALEDGLELIDAEIDNLSALISELRPAALDEIGLVPALRTLAERKERVANVAIDLLVRLGDGERLEPETESTIYRLVQEALNNVAKHAGASRAEVIVERTDRRVTISVRDDGRGFDPEAPVSGFGLLGMRERVELAGGELNISAAPGRGTTIQATLPTEAGQSAGLGSTSSG